MAAVVARAHPSSLKTYTTRMASSLWMYDRTYMEFRCEFEFQSRSRDYFFGKKCVCHTKIAFKFSFMNFSIRSHEFIFSNLAHNFAIVICFDPFTRDFWNCINSLASALEWLLGSISSSKPHNWLSRKVCLFRPTSGGSIWWASMSLGDASREETHFRIH